MLLLGIKPGQVRLILRGFHSLSFYFCNSCRDRPKSRLHFLSEFNGLNFLKRNLSIGTPDQPGVGRKVAGVLEGANLRAWPSQ